MSTETTSVEIKLTPVDQQVLEQIAMFGLSVEDSVAKLSMLETKGHRAVARLLNRMRKRRLVRFEPLYGSRDCIRLGSRGLHALRNMQLPIRFDSRPLSEESKIRALALLSFCMLSDPQRTPLIDKSDKENNFTWSSYYREQSVEQRIGFLRVDMGGRGRWDRILAKCEHDGISMRGDPRFAEAVTSARAEVSVAVALPQKAERLRQAISDHPLALPIRIVVIPELLYLIAPPPES